MLHLTNWMLSPELPFFSKITIDNDYSLHNHDFFEIFYMLSGSLEHTLNGKNAVVKQGEVYFLLPQDVHAFFRSEQHNGTHRDIVISKRYFRELCDSVSPSLYEEYIGERLPRHVMLSDSKINEIENILQQISAMPSNKNDVALMASHLAFMKLFEPVLLLKINNSVKSGTGDWFQALLKRFDNEALVKQGLDAILEPFYFTKSYICRTFKKHMNITMTEYLNGKRLEYATYLLKFSDSNISTIINEFGFSSVPYFNKIFKKKYGCTPREFRKQPEYSF